MGEMYLFLCSMGMCGDIKLKDMKHTRNPEEDPSLVCPHCGGCEWYIVPNDKKECEF